MNRWHLLVLLSFVGWCAAQETKNATATASDVARVQSATCRDSHALACVRTCCAKGENAIKKICTASSTVWSPTFLNASTISALEIVGGFISPCNTLEAREVTLTRFLDASTQYMLKPSGELDVLTNERNYSLGHDYCFYNIEANQRLYESVKACADVEVPQVYGLPNINDVKSVPIRKCCSTDQMLDVVDKKFACVNNVTKWPLSVIHDYPTKLIQLPKDKADISASDMFKCPKDTATEYLTSTNIDHVHFLQSDGQLHLASYNVTVPSGMFCQDQLRVAAVKSPPPISVACYGKAQEHTKEQYESLCPNGECVRKCCAPNFHMYRSKCTPTKQNWSPIFYEGEDIIEKEVPHAVIYGRAACDGGNNFVFSARLSDQDVPFLQRNGDISVPKLNITYKAHQCCIDFESYLNDTSNTVSIYETAICCHPIDLEKKLHSLFTSILLTMSAVFLFIMLAIYMLVPKLRNIHGKCLMSHAAALFIAFFLAVYQQFVRIHLGPGCEALGFFLYYFFIAALFWLNVMSFDIWWTFANLRTRPPSERSLRNRFIRHSLYAWGVPAVMTALLAFFNYAPESVLPEGAVLRPGIGHRQCFLADPKTELYYFFLPIFIVTGVNIVFFVATAVVLHRAEKSTRILNRKRTARDRLKVYVNLFIIMEVSWIAECLSSQIGPPQIWYITDILNASQGTIIFVLFIVRASTRKTIRERFVELTKYGITVATTGRIHPVKTPDQRNPNGSSSTKVTNASSSSARKSSEVDGMGMTTLKTGGAEEDTDGQATVKGGGEPQNEDISEPSHSSAPRDSQC